MSKIIKELNIGLTDPISEALEVAAEFNGMKQGQYVRQAVLQKLVAEGFMQHPLAAKAAAQAKG